MKFDTDLVNDVYAIQTTIIPNDLAQYSTDFALNGIAVTMLCGYNTRTKTRWVSVKTKDATPLLQQTFLQVGRRCELNFNSNISGLNGYVTLREISSGEADYLKWSKRYLICFITYEQTVIERLENNLRVKLVGN